MASDWGVRANELSAEAIRNGEPTAWFDRLYAEGASGGVSLPWDHTGPHPLLQEWAQDRQLTGGGRRAVVVGSGLGGDAGYLAELGFDTTGFDISPTAVRIAAERFPAVDFQLGDLLDLPAPWRRAFALVVEIFTLQALPDPPRSAAMRGVAELVAEGGTLLAVQFRDDGSPPEVGPPFPLPEATMHRLAGDQLSLVHLEPLEGPLWRAEYRR